MVKKLPLDTKMNDIICRGSYALNTACGVCSKCKKEYDYLFNKINKENKNIGEFTVKCYCGENPIIKGNGFDGLNVGDNREDAEEFIEFVNNLIKKEIRLKN